MPIVAIVVLGVLMLAYFVMYNGLVRARQKVKEAWSGVEVQLKRRLDLIPNLINTVKGYAEHEKSLLESVTQKRTEVLGMSSGPSAARVQAENALSTGLRSIFAVAENYPQLRASENFVALQQQLAETEDQISAARRVFNSNAQELNTKVESFPSNIVARLAGFVQEAFFELDAGEREAANKAPTVQF